MSDELVNIYPDEAQHSLVVHLTEVIASADRALRTTHKYASRIIQKLLTLDEDSTLKDFRIVDSYIVNGVRDLTEALDHIGEALKELKRSTGGLHALLHLEADDLDGRVTEDQLNVLVHEAITALMDEKEAGDTDKS